MSSSEPEKASDEVPRPSELVDASGAGPQARGEPAERVLSGALAQVRDGLRSPDPGAVNEAIGSLLRSEAARGLVVAILQRSDAFQSELTQERVAHAVTRSNLRHALERGAGQLLLQVVGSGFFGVGLTQANKSWWDVGSIILGLVMILIGVLPAIPIKFPWSNNK